MARPSMDWGINSAMSSLSSQMGGASGASLDMLQKILGGGSLTPNETASSKAAKTLTAKQKKELQAAMAQRAIQGFLTAASAGGGVGGWQNLFGVSPPK